MQLLVALHDQKDTKIIQLQKELLQHQEALSDSQKDIKSKSGLIEILEKRCTSFQNFLQKSDAQKEKIACIAIQLGVLCYLKQSHKNALHASIDNQRAYNQSLGHMNKEYEKTLALEIEVRELQEKQYKKRMCDFETSIAHHIKAEEAFKKAAQVLQQRVRTLEAENRRLQEQIPDTQASRPRFFSF